MAPQREIANTSDHKVGLIRGKVTNFYSNFATVDSAKLVPGQRIGEIILFVGLVQIQNGKGLRACFPVFSSTEHFFLSTGRLSYFKCDVQAR